MKLIKVIARERIIDPSTKKIHTDEGLRALDGYYEETIEVDESYDINEGCLKVKECTGFRDFVLEITEI